MALRRARKTVIFEATFDSETLKAHFAEEYQRQVVVGDQSEEDFIKETVAQITNGLQQNDWVTKGNLVRVHDSLEDVYWEKGYWEKETE